ncbi:transposase, partial [Paraglaciecola aquimarina]
DVTFSYKDYRQPTQQKTMTLSGVEFIRRYLTHVLPKGFMRVRHFGFLANRCRAKKLDMIQQQTKKRTTSALEKVEQAMPICWPCPTCKIGILRLATLILPS